MVEKSQGYMGVDRDQNSFWNNRYFCIVFRISQ